jgi:sulfide dehydrogenase [flavocytochrome c] flavoprotein subunit
VGVMRRREFLAGAALLGAAWRTRAATAGRAQVVVAGGGFAGAGCALALRRLAPALAVTLVDPDAHYVTCPASSQVLAQLRDLGSITVSRAGLQRAGIRYLRDRVTDFDARQRVAHTASGQALRYDRLVVAPGIRLLYGTPEGYDAAAQARLPAAWQGGADLARLRTQLQGLPAGGTVAISVPGGLMRCPPGPYERASLIAWWLKQHRPRAKVLIFDANNHFPRQDLFTTAWQQLYPGMIEWIAPGQGGLVTRVDPASRTLYSDSGAHRFDVANIIPPQAPGSLAPDTGLSAGHGWCPVSAQTFESESVPGVHVIGDACIAGAMPKSASAARSQAQRCAAAIVAALAERELAAQELDSVCYSMLAADSALAIRGRFSVRDGVLAQAADAQPPAAPCAATATEARAWYADIRRECLGA